MADEMPELEVRIPVRYFDMMMDGDITGSMMLTMSMLYRWSDWGTGRVKRVSAEGLVTATHDAYHRNTYQDALRKWEEMGEITREMTLGSHKSYPVLIHNYRKRALVRDRETKELVWKTVTINRWKTITYDEFKKGLRAEPLDGAPTEGVYEGVAEAPTEAPTEGVERTCIDEHNLPSGLQDEQENGHGEHQQQQGPVPAAAEASPGGNSKPKAGKPKPGVPVQPASQSVTEITCELPWSRVLAGWVGMWMGLAPKSVPRKWGQDIQEMEAMLLSYGIGTDMSALLDWLVFSEDKNAARYREKVQKATISPTGLMKTLLPEIADAYNVWDAQQGWTTLENNLKELLAEKVPYERNGRLYRFIDTKGHGPCWCEVIGDKFYPVPPADAVGLDLPFPLDGTAEDDVVESDLDYKKERN